MEGAPLASIVCRERRIVRVPSGSSYSALGEFIRRSEPSTRSAQGDRADEPDQLWSYALHQLKALFAATVLRDVNMSEQS